MASIKNTKTTKKLISKSLKSVKPSSTKKSKTPSEKKTIRPKTIATPSKKRTAVLMPKKVSTTSTVSMKKVTTSRKEKKLKKIKLQLLSQKESLLNEAEVALNELPGQTVFPDLGDQASAETDRGFMLRLRGREQRLLKKIDEALDRLDNGIFGICEDCGEQIELKRLEARPVTTMCIDCKTLQEEEEKLRES